MTDDAALAVRIAVDAVTVLEQVRARRTAADLGAAGDAAAQSAIAAALAAARPADAVLSEEAADDPARLDAERVWIVDPLDGTREYAEGRDDWAVHIALWTRERGLVAGAVASSGVVHSTADRRPAPQRSSRLRLAVSRSRPPAFLPGLASALDAETVPMGSAGVKAMAVVDGAADAYVHAGGQYEWDSAAPVAVAVAAGLRASRIDGSPLVWNRRDPWQPDLLICPTGVADRILATIAALSSEDEG